MRRPQLFLILAFATFGLTAPLIRWLVLHGGSLSGAESSAISFCMAKASVLTPVFGLFFAFVLLGESPDRAQWLAAVVILGGMLLGGGAAAAQRPEVQGMERTLAAA